VGQTCARFEESIDDPSWLRSWHWRGLRLLHGLDARLLRYRYPAITR